MERQKPLFPTEEYETGESFASKLYDRIVEQAAFAADGEIDGPIEGVIAEMVPDEETAWSLILLIANENKGILDMRIYGEDLRGTTKLELLRSIIQSQIFEEICYLELSPEKWLAGKYPDFSIIEPVGWVEAGIPFDQPISDDRFWELFHESVVTVPDEE